MSPGVQLRVRFPVDDVELSELHQLAFGADVTLQPWAARLARHSLTWVGALDDDDPEALVGFVHQAWDGGTDAFVLDTAVHPARKGRGTGRDLVRRRYAGPPRRLHLVAVDHGPQLGGFYGACGFRPTEAGLPHLAAQGPPPDFVPLVLPQRHRIWLPDPLSAAPTR